MQKKRKKEYINILKNISKRIFILAFEITEKENTQSLKTSLTGSFFYFIIKNDIANVKEGVSRG